MSLRESGMTPKQYEDMLEKEGIRKKLEAPLALFPPEVITALADWRRKQGLMRMENPEVAALFSLVSQYEAYFKQHGRLPKPIES